MMNYKRINIKTASPSNPRAGVMIIYTGGTLGMARDKDGVLIPFDFGHIPEYLPTLRSLQLDITVISFENPVDSSNIEPPHWQIIGKIIFENYSEQDGFVVLHGTDTMAYTASALSFMLRNISKPVIFTGAQLPISEPRSDARENMITALEIASAQKDDKAIVPEVCVYFDYELIRGCRAKKVQNMHFDAFQSENYPPLAKAGVKIDYAFDAIRSESGKALELLDKFDTNVGVLKLFPGIGKNVVKSIVEAPQLRGLILETYGAGNAPTTPWFIDTLGAAIKRGVLVINISQCPGGMVTQGRYETSKTLDEIGVISGADMTSEAATSKLMLLLGEYGSESAEKMMEQSIAGELSAN